MATPTFRRNKINTSELERTPRFSNQCQSVLGSPFLTTSDLPADTDVPRASTSQAGSSSQFVAYDGAELEPIDGAFGAVPRAFTVTRPPSPAPSFRTDNYSIINWNAEAYTSAYGNARDEVPQCLPTGRRTMATYYPYAMSFDTDGTPTPLKSARSLTLGMGILPRIWDALREGSPGRKGKRRPGLPSVSLWREGIMTDGEDIDWHNMPPLDGEEGELIDDEACFIDVTRVTGTDIVAHLPTELALHLLCFLDLVSVLAGLRVSKTWNRLLNDNSVWHSLFAQREKNGWRVEMQRAQQTPSRVPLSASRSLVLAPLEIDWYKTYRIRAELDQRWSSGPIVTTNGEGKEEIVPAFEPKVKRLSGHHDSVYCLEFDSERIITGSRDRTIKVWSLKTGRCLATFVGHRGSVLCLKFDKDWDLNNSDDDSSSTVDSREGANRWKRGFMVSGSSDCSVCVWDLCSRVRLDKNGEPLYGEDREVAAELSAVLRGHTGGVLDLKIDARWIVSCSKDMLIRVWDRQTMKLHCTFRGHEGPVNAVGMQGNRVVSASGDGKMMLWDIVSKERLRVFEGHDRGLACIEFKDDLIVSGSNDCKIKVWSASEGTCLRTLPGHDMLVRALSFDPLSGRLVSGSYDKTVKVWDLHTGKMLRVLRGCHNSHIFDVKFDHCRIVSTSHDQKIVVLDFAEDLDVSLFV